jgi:predicted nuclease of predicted toxin-antitoxin system
LIRLLADENLNAALVRALETRLPAEALTTVQDLGLRGDADDDLLRYAAERELVLISHDRQTLPGIAYARIGRGERCPGVVIVRDPEEQGMARLVDDLVLLALAGRREDFEDQVRYLPLTS